MGRKKGTVHTHRLVLGDLLHVIGVDAKGVPTYQHPGWLKFEIFRTSTGWKATAPGRKLHEITLKQLVREIQRVSAVGTPEPPKPEPPKPEPPKPEPPKPEPPKPEPPVNVPVEVEKAEVVSMVIVHPTEIPVEITRTLEQQVSKAVLDVMDTSMKLLDKVKAQEEVLKLIVENIVAWRKEQEEVGASVILGIQVARWRVIEGMAKKVLENKWTAQPSEGETS